MDVYALLGGREALTTFGSQLFAGNHVFLAVWYLYEYIDASLTSEGQTGDKRNTKNSAHAHFLQISLNIFNKE